MKERKKGEKQGTVSEEGVEGHMAALEEQKTGEYGRSYDETQQM
jgi:hypothetical protein